MTDDHDQTSDLEADPTGMRALLRALPDPGPMPPELVARISAALAAEAREATLSGDRTDGPEDSATPPPGPGVARFVDGGSGALRPRMRMPRLAAAAVIVALVGIGGAGLLKKSLTINDVGTAMGAAASSMESLADTSGGSPAREDAEGMGQDLLGAQVPDGGTVVLASSRPYTIAALVPMILGVGAGSGDAAAPEAASSADVRVALPEGVGALATPEGARACAEALDIPAEAAVAVDLGRVDAEPAAVVLARSPAGVLTAYVVRWSCSAADPALVAGPVAVT